MSKIRLSSAPLVDSIVDGVGLRVVVWTQGCPHLCEGCHNPNTHSFTGGKDYDTSSIIEQMSQYSYHDGVTFSGGEPFAQPIPLIEIAKAVRKLNWNIWCYTGYLYEDLLIDPDKFALLKEIDVLIDGPFILGQRTLSKPFIGSLNQRIIDVQSSIKNNKVIECEL